MLWCAWQDDSGAVFSGGVEYDRETCLQGQVQQMQMEVEKYSDDRLALQEAAAMSAELFEEILGKAFRDLEGRHVVLKGIGVYADNIFQVFHGSVERSTGLRRLDQE